MFLGFVERAGQARGQALFARVWARRWRLLRLLLLLSLLTCTFSAQAAMVLSQTRVVVTQASPSAVITVRNADRQPLLLQTWVDAGQGRQAVVAPVQDDTPFLVDPPVMRLEPGETRSLHVLLVHVPAELAPDRESLFWLNVLEVAAMPTLQDHDARLDVSVLSRLKLFYRPQPYRPVAAQRLRFTLAREGEDAWLTIHNPAPIHQTLGRLTLRGKDAALALDAPMVAPFADARVRVPSAVLSGAASTGWTLDFSVLDDDGNEIRDEENLALAR